MKEAREFTKRLSHDNVGAFAAQAAYFILLSLIPMLLLFMTLIQFTSVSKDMASNMLMQVVPAEFQSLVERIIGEVYAKSTSVVPVSLVVTLWSAGKGVNALTAGFNSIYHVPETRGYIIGRVRSAFYTLMFILAVIASLVLMVFGNTIQKSLEKYVPVLARVTSFILSMRTLIMVVALTVLFLFLYKFIPNRKTAFRSQLPGAMFSSVAWAVFSLGFSFYLDNFPGFSNMYGSLTTLVIVMLWMYFCMYIILIGAEINFNYEDKLKGLQNSTKRRIREEYQNLIDNPRKDD
ncbi:YihY/virulence factor BrkB family protein [Blautia liquoris]|uniref:YihY/virulence factor BrkB family protein n=1 Tax=Blautia liquoris TaxID=2779518 RepID=A0A7M2RMD9_9FIRM|nr:YihY/virulence factor BrkB family protein [Blautia liquoris]QOV20500.1 YihY/virulence factor BrkB family protein [Blautia liquoris]